MGYHKLCESLKSVTSTTYEETCKGAMFGGGSVAGTSNTAVTCKVSVGPTKDGPWTESFALNTQYSGMIALGQFYTDKWLKVEVSGTGATFDGYLWYN